jgi:glycosyltransferase involved in cell wall biosynthesis
MTNLSEHKILYVSPNGYLGGAETFVLNSLIGHKNRGHQASVLFFNEGEFSKACQEKGIDTYVIKNKFSLKNIFKLIKACFEVRSFIKANNFEIVHTTMPYSHIVISLALQFTKVKKVWFQHGPVGGTLDLIASFFSCDQIYFNSKYLKTEHNKMPLAGKSNNQYIINLGIPETTVTSERITTIRETYLSSEEQELWILPGRITSWKGQHLIIEALKEFEEEQLKKINLLIIGEPKRDSDRDYLSHLEALVEKNKLNEYVKFIGHQKDIMSFFAATDLVVHCSTTPEPFGLVVAEAMMQKKLVIGSSIGGISDILIHQETGLSYDTTSPKAPALLHEILSEYLDKKYDIERIRNNAQKLIKSKYSLDHMMNQLEKLYLELL